MHFKAGDNPGSLVFLLPDDWEDSAVTGAAVKFGGLAKPTAYSAGTMTVTPGALPTAGRIDVTATLTLAAGGTTTISLEPIIVEPAQPDGWHTLDSIRRQWPDAPEEDEDLYSLLAVSKDEFLFYLGEIASFGEIPEAWRRAQYLQARAWWQAGRVNRDGDGLGAADSTIRVWTLDSSIKRLLIPQRRMPVIV